MSQIKMIGLPIGNIKDITIRALESLREAKVVFCEDTKSFRKLMGLLDIEIGDKRIDSFHDHSKDYKIQKILNYLNQGQDVVFVSEAGSPIISDPAYPILEAVVYNSEHEIETVPGPTSLVAALELSALPPNPIHFFGFLPRDKSAIETQIESSLTISGTHIYFESPNRIKKTVDILCQKMPENWQICICREISKLHQQAYRFKRDEWNEKKEEVKELGECVLLFYVPKSLSLHPLHKEFSALALNVLNKPGHQKSLAKLISKILNSPTGDVYRQLTEAKLK